ncbi:MAG: hypothetical protein AMXMBFR6_02720 [Betaproteobacteria bacterium]
MIPQPFIQGLLDRIDIVDLVGRHVPLRKAGANFVACCPFHDEKTPSFTVSPSKQFFHCFGCGAHGSAIGFLMAHAGLGFREAVEDLARQVGLALPEESRSGQAGGTGEANHRQSLTGLLARAAEFYRDALRNSPAAIAYLRGRGVSGIIAARYGLGYAPDSWQGLRTATPDYAAPELREAGLVLDGDEGRRYDRFRHRIMFPIVDGRGEVVGFGARALDGAEPKYLNSPETPVFAKGRQLYGLPQARKAAREAGTLLVVEGYMDVIALAQHGIENVVATLGTATTTQHIQLLLRQSDRVIFCFDGDNAGRKAAWRALLATLGKITDGQSVRFVFLPAEHDPDSYVRALGADAFRALLAQALPLSAYFIRELAMRHELAHGEGRAALLKEASQPLAGMAAPMLRSQIVHALAEQVGLAAAEVERLCGLRGRMRRAPPALGFQRVRPATPAHRLLRILLAKPELAPQVPVELSSGVGADQQALRALLALYADRQASGAPASGSLGALIEYFRGRECEVSIAAALRSLEHDEARRGDAEDHRELDDEFADIIEDLQLKALSERIAVLTEKVRNGPLDADELDELRRLHAEKHQRRTRMKSRIDL